MSTQDATTSKRKSTDGEPTQSQKLPRLPEQPPKPTAQGPSALVEEAEALYCQQMDVIERRLEVLLPSLMAEDLSSTAVVVNKLEQAMQKPVGRLQKFKMEIGRIRRMFLEGSLSEHLRKR